MKLIASLAPARAEIEAGVVAKADQKIKKVVSTKKNIFQAVMRRYGHNPTYIEVADIIIKVHDETGSVGFEVRQQFKF